MFKFFHAPCLFNNFARAGRGAVIIKVILREPENLEKIRIVDILPLLAQIFVINDFCMF